jgi:hypothetical protein
MTPTEALTFLTQVLNNAQFNGTMPQIAQQMQQCQKAVETLGEIVKSPAPENHIETLQPPAG